MLHSLGLVYRLRHGQEDTVDQDGEHHNVVEVLVRAEVDGEAADLQHKTRTQRCIQQWLSRFRYRIAFRDRCLTTFHGAKSHIALVAENLCT